MKALRTLALTVVHEGRLLRRDPVVPWMLLLAPIAIIVVAGSSLGDLYGTSGREVSLPVVDRDGGAVAERILAALAEEPRLRIERVADVESARARVGDDGAPLALEIPPGTTRALAEGTVAELVLHVDAARRLEANGVELALGALCRRLDLELHRQVRAASGIAPGSLDLVARPALPGGSLAADAFAQYVPGFGVTFLLVGMMLGISLTLFDEREWGTLERLRASGVSLPAIVCGKVLARTLVGIAQMAVLFATGRVLFGISLGHAPAALLLPTAAMSFAAAALGLAVPALARTRDAVMPLGTMISMTISAVGGCWWPIAFEPEWLRRVASVLPTTWTMRAYGDLMIRGAPASVALAPSLATTALGIVLLALGVRGVLRETR